MALVISEYDQDENEYNQTARVVDGVVSDTSLFELYDEETWKQERERWFADRLNGPELFASRVPDEDVEPIAMADGSPLHGNHHCTLSLADEDTDKWLGWEHDMFELQHGIAHGAGSRTLTEIVESEMPSFVKERIRDAIMSDAFFSDFATIDGEQLMQLRLFFEEQLMQDGWTTDMIAGRLQDLEAGLSRSDAESIARTESQALINEAREEGYQETGMVENEKFYWVGSLDDRTTDACMWLIGGSDEADKIGGSFSGTNPNHGGIPRSLDKLKELVQEAAKKDPDIDTDARKFTPHINCRKTYVRDV